ncbi:hypothetical protein [Pseudactinotalea sp.]|uniref:hypothetical protein n=1 Tax=Pseudactinotalea sp. TaxID=1926260 RepID=UPI003B3BBFEC
MARKAPQTYTVRPGQWLVLIAHETGFPTILTVEPDQEQATAWRDELARRITAMPEAGTVLTDPHGRVFLAPRHPGVAASLTVGSPFTGPREILLLRVEGRLAPLPHHESDLHRLLPGHFPDQ